MIERAPPASSAPASGIPPSLSIVTVYEDTGPPLAGAVQVTFAESFAAVADTFVGRPGTPPLVPELVVPLVVMLPVVVLLLPVVDAPVVPVPPPVVPVPVMHNEPPSPHALESE
jgi:hypothetical protein